MLYEAFLVKTPGQLNHEIKSARHFFRLYPKHTQNHANREVVAKVHSLFLYLENVLKTDGRMRYCRSRISRSGNKT
jgi:hypothetical protein